MGSARKTIAVVPLSDTMADTARRDATLLAPAALGDRASDDEPFFDIDPNRQPDLWERAGEAYLHRLMGPFVGHLRAALRAETNAVLIRGLAPDVAPPPAPYTGRSSFTEIGQTLRNAFGVLGLMGAQSFAYATENAGHVMRDVVARTDARHERSSQGWGEELPWHMDGAFRPMVESATSALSPAPRWLVFGVIYDTPRVPLTFISVDGVLKQLRRRDVLALGQPEFDVLSPASFAVRQVTRGVSILLPDENGGYYSRFNAISCIGQTTAARNALAALSEALRDTTAPNRIELAAGDVVVLDNWRSLGMRSAFSPRWDGRDRWMVRMYAAPSRQAGVPQSEETPRLWQ